MSKIIAVDFDGTIVSHMYPKIGVDNPNAIRVLKKLIEQGHQLILWTMRSGPELDEGDQRELDRILARIDDWTGIGVVQG